MTTRFAASITPVLLLCSLPALSQNAPGGGIPPSPTAPSVVPPVSLAPSKTKPGLDETPVASRLSADSVRYEGGVVIAEGSAEHPARFLSGAGQITAQTVRVDTANRTLKASGGVMLQRTRMSRSRVLRSSHLQARYERSLVTDTLRGENLDYDFKSRTGHLDKGQVQVANFDLMVNELMINGDRYTARNVVLRPGAQTPEEDKIYGVPPLNLKAKEITITVPPDLKAHTPPTVTAKGAALYFNNTRLLPIPRAVFGLTRRINKQRDTKAFDLTPGMAFNSTDGVILTTRVTVPLSQNPQGLQLIADIGASAKQTFRGGVSLELNNKFGQFALRGKVKDIVTHQLFTNKFLVDRVPELTYQSPDLRLFKLGGRQAGLRFDAGIGDFKEKVLQSATGFVGASLRSSRRTAGLTFTTRMNDEFGTTRDGVYLDLFATTSRYSANNARYRTAGFEIGYDGRITSRLNGVLSYRHNHINGATPFLFDQVEIPRELRSTFDYRLTPRFLIPIDLRYDLDQKKMRDRSIGLLRAYKSFAYGVIYDSAREDLRLEFRAGF